MGDLLGNVLRGDNVIQDQGTTDDNADRGPMSGRFSTRIR